jgi:hypothetical protein
MLRGVDSCLEKALFTFQLKEVDPCLGRWIHA